MPDELIFYLGYQHLHVVHYANLSWVPVIAEFAEFFFRIYSLHISKIKGKNKKASAGR
jgi:hypothetical protein